MSSAPDAHDLRAHAVWLQQFFAAVDRMDAPAVAVHFEADNGCFRFANHQPMQGREAVAQGCAGIFGLLDSIRHEVLEQWLARGDLIVEGRVHYQRRDGFRLSVPFMSVFQFGSASPGLIQSYRVFVDSHELFEAARSQ